ncbi:MAG TPA: NrpR regulatory domain-containing protein [Phycisphaerae bacterium]|nr:NrpR regulatory domain-containing protein [Phycisphaerae bacterium]
MHTDRRRTIVAILRVLDEAGRPVGSTKIARGLQASGIDLAQRMVRNYLAAMDAEGLTVNLGRAGRELTARGRNELAAAGAIDKVGFIDARGEELAYQMTFDLRRRRGTVILNLSTVPAAQIDDVRQAMAPVLRAGLGMGRFGTIDGVGTHVPGLLGPVRDATIGTMCALTLNGLLATAGVPVVSRFGGLLEMRDGEPFRFVHIIQYGGTTLDPIEIFIKARMTRVQDAARTGNGIIGASFREVPAIALPRVHKLIREMAEASVGGMVVVGDPGRPLAEIPVDQGRVGLIVAAGLNPIAAVQEAGIPTENRAMARLADFETLVPLV